MNKQKPKIQIPKSLNEFQTQVYSALSSHNYESESDQCYLKSYLVESNTDKIPSILGFDEWRKLGDANAWYICEDCLSHENYIVLFKYSDRIWILYSLAPVVDIDRTIDRWISSTRYLDRCWFSGNILSTIGRENNWQEKGIGLRYTDSTSPSEYKSQMSLKMWYGSEKQSRIKEFLEIGRGYFATNSIRWADISGGSTVMRSEWYSNGKISVTHSEDVTELFQSIGEVAKMYENTLNRLNNYRVKGSGAFEFEFTQSVDLDEYSEAVEKGKNDLKLWMCEIESGNDYKRFRGVDLHTWDRVFLDITSDYAYMVIPGKGCLNAVPRMVAVHGENVFGKTSVSFNKESIDV